MRKNFMFEENDILYKLSEEEINKRKNKRISSIEKSNRFVVYLKPDMSRISEKLKMIRMEEEEIRLKRRIKVIDVTKNSRFFK